jgi:hypothetical protein
MPEKIEVAKMLSVKYEEVFNIKNLYVFLRDWLKDRGYLDDQNEKEKWMETYYLDKSSPGGKELWFWWRTDRVPDDNQYLQYKLNLDFHVLALKDVEIVHQGKKVKAHKGEIEVLISAWVIFDPKDTFGKSGFLKRYFKTFTDKIYRDQLEAKKAELTKDINELQAAIKQYLEQKAITSEELFHPARGLA